MYPVTKETIRDLEEKLLPELLPAAPPPAGSSVEKIVVFRQHKFYKHLVVELYEATTTRAGKLKNPLRMLNPLDTLWQTESPQLLKFYTAVTRFQHQIREGKTVADIEALKALIKNPAELPFYAHNAQISENVTADSLESFIVAESVKQMQLVVEKKPGFYVVSGQLTINNKPVDCSALLLKHDYFVDTGASYHLLANIHFLKLIEFLKQHQYRLMIKEAEFPVFQHRVLATLEEKIAVSYTFMKQATLRQLKEQGMDKPPERMIYLTDAALYVNINPVMRYGEVEVPIRTKKQVYAEDSKGIPFVVKRNDAEELEFMALLMQQHPDFFEQAENDFNYFHLPKADFLQENWFLNAFAHWRDAGIAIYGFNDIANNRLNQHKANINIVVTSGTNWFNTLIEAKFGKKKASQKKLYKAVRNKSRYVELDDGTLGILPEEWLEKFISYFNAGEWVNEMLLTPKVNFSEVDKLYDQQMLDAAAVVDLQRLNKLFLSSESIKEVEAPADLHVTLRHYQWQGLNWLNFLDDLNFGGCLADDMGLGKSLQIIAFILLQRAKRSDNVNLIIAPTSLLFNWKNEIEKAAPSITWYEHYGAGRTDDITVFSKYEVVLTSYGTLVSDIELFRNISFNYIFADESQHIKNIESQRYKAMRMLQSRNKIVITGTPLENNTFDLYGQLSFACPGLLGNRQHFRDIYAIPIDRFKETKRARELQEKIRPFMLRRTKQQVAAELPDKTEMVLYCSMGPEQRKAYDAYEKEFRDYLEGIRDEDVTTTTMHVLKGITKLRQICNSPALLGDEALYGNASAKLEMLMEQLEEKTGRHKILVFSQFVSMLQLVEKELVKRKKKYVMLTGSTVNREAVVNEFKENDDVRVFLISLKAGGVGLNLTEADYVYLIDPWWNPAVENQAIDRCYRIGQKKNVVAVRLICPDTVEEKIMKLQAAKKDLVEDLVKTDMLSLLRTVLAGD